ncbi:hypothetical protein [Bacteroides sedimenti]
MVVDKFIQMQVLVLAFIFCPKMKAEIRSDSIKSSQINVNVKSGISNSEIKKIVIEQLIKSSGDSLKYTDVESVKYWGKYNLVDLGESRIYKIKLSYSLPNVWHYPLVLIVDSNGNAYLVNLDMIELIKIKGNSNDYYFAGRYKNRYCYGVFKIFGFINNSMYQIFESEEPVSNHSLDCESYKNDNLKLKNIDLNNDGYFDLKFSGIKYSYCDGLEQYGRDERKPIKKEKITIVYYYNSVDKTWQKKL